MWFLIFNPRKAFCLRFFETPKFVYSFSIGQNALQFINYSWPARRKYALWNAQNKRIKAKIGPVALI